MRVRGVGFGGGRGRLGDGGCPFMDSGRAFRTAAVAGWRSGAPICEKTLLSGWHRTCILRGARYAVNSFVQDVLFAVRQLRKTPVFALTATVTLALGIGANTAMFSVVDQVLLRAMPFPHAEQVVQMATGTENGGFSSTSLPDIRDWQARSHSFEGIGFYSEQMPTLGGAADPKLVVEVASSANLFGVLGARPMMGRTFAPEDDKAGHTNVVVLNASLWREYFHGDRQIVGRTVPINGMPYTVIGVMGDGFSFPGNNDSVIWTPVPVDDATLQDRGSSSLSVIARLRPGVSLAAATHEMNGIHEQLRREYPKDEEASPIRMERYPEVVTGSARPTILALDAAVVAVWLIACANVAGLLLARGSARRREVALRTALGAGRGRLIRQFLTEGLLLSAAGGMLGLLLAEAALRVLKTYLANAVVYGEGIHIDGRVCAYLVAASCVSAVLFGLVPALVASSVPAQEALREGSAGSGTSRGQARWRNGVVIGEVALTLTLLVAAGVMVRTLLSLRRTHTGFVAEHVVTGQIYLPSRSPLAFGTPTDTGAPSMVQTLYEPLLARLRALPGMEAVGLTTVRPLEAGWNFNMTVELEGHAKPERSSESYAQARATSAGYFTTMGIRLLAGRFFATTDTAAGAPVAIVNRAFAKRFLPNGNVLGQRVRMNEAGPRQWSTIVGVVDDSPQKTLGQAPLPEVHYNLAQLLPTDDLYPILGTFYMNVVVRSSESEGAETTTRELRRTIHDLAPEAALDNVQSMQAVVDGSLGSQVLAARLLSLFAFAGLLIAAAGVYGLLSYSVGQRTRELGVRFALGAERGDVLWLVLRQAVGLLVVGVGVGAVLTAACARVFVAMLPYRWSAADGLVALGVVGVLGVCLMGASYVPARRASRTDPVIALRSE